MFGLAKKSESPPQAELRALLSGLKLFSWMDDGQLAKLVGITRVSTLKKGKFLLKEGDASNSLFVVAKGLLRVEERGKDGAEIALGVVRQGEMIGEMGLLTGEPRSASAIAAEDSQILEVSRLEFLALEAKTEFLHFKVWCAFALHRCKTHLIESGKTAAMTDSARAAWLAKFEITELKMAEEAPAPPAAGFIFVAHGLVTVDLQEVKAPALVALGPKPHLTGASAHAVVLWLPAV